LFVQVGEVREGLDHGLDVRPLNAQFHIDLRAGYESITGSKMRARLAVACAWPDWTRDYSLCKRAALFALHNSG
jgi:hypothetical protein